METRQHPLTRLAGGIAFIAITGWVGMTVHNTMEINRLQAEVANLQSRQVIQTADLKAGLDALTAQTTAAMTAPSAQSITHKVDETVKALTEFYQGPPDLPAGDQVAVSLDDVIISAVNQQWHRPPAVRNGINAEVRLQMEPDGRITSVTISRSSGDPEFDKSTIEAVRRVGRIPEMQQLDRATFDKLYRQRRMVFKPEDMIFHR